jgi:Flp pilus assembly protein TadD
MGANAVSDKQWQLASSGNAISQALVAYCHADYNTAVDTLKSSMSAMNRLGGTTAQQDIVKQTLVEACLRSNRLLEARLLLCERTALAPNEAQSWRRLASVFGRMGDQQLAEAAHYTSWQLGIAQGGFGGAR